MEKKSVLVVFVFGAFYQKSSLEKSEKRGSLKRFLINLTKAQEKIRKKQIKCQYNFVEKCALFLNSSY